MRFDNNFKPRNNKKWQLARNENLTRFGSLYTDFSAFHTYVAKQLGIEKEWVCLTNGAEEAVRICLSTPDFENRYHFDPTWGLVSVLNNLYGKSTKTYGFYANYQEIVYESEKLLVDIEKNPGLVYIANPNTPTGSKFAIDKLINIINTNPNSHFIVDESYYEFNENRSLVGYFHQLNNLTIIRNFSKAHGLANKRFGCYITKNKTLLDIRPANPCSEETITHVVASYERVDDMVESIQKGKEQLESYFKKHTKVLNSYTNFLILEYKEKLFEKLSKIAYFHTFEVNTVKYIKITAIPDYRVKEFIHDIES